MSDSNIDYGMNEEYIENRRLAYIWRLKTQLNATPKTSQSVRKQLLALIKSAESNGGNAWPSIQPWLKDGKK
jgi:hypothetical protein